MNDPTPAKRAADCPMCSGPIRRTVGMVCPTCGTDYAPGAPILAEQAAIRRAAAASVGIEHDLDTDEVLARTERSAAAELSRLGQEHPTEQMPRKLTAAELVAADAIAAEHNRQELAVGYTAAAMPGEFFADFARVAVAAVHQPIADEVALQLGREVLRDGLAPFLHRLVGPENTARLLAPIAAKALREAALMARGDEVRPLLDSDPDLEPVLVCDLLSRADDIEEAADQLEQEARDE